MKGYPFYSIEGKSIAIATGTLRVPVFREKHIPLGWFIMQNSTLGFIGQIGDAWSQSIDEPNWLRSVGIQWRINGFSFYNFTTAIGLELHQGLDRFRRQINNKSVTYGQEQRFYLTILFGF